MVEAVWRTVRSASGQVDCRLVVPPDRTGGGPARVERWGGDPDVVGARSRDVEVVLRVISFRRLFGIRFAVDVEVHAARGALSFFIQEGDVGAHAEIAFIGQFGFAPDQGPFRRRGKGAGGASRAVSGRELVQVGGKRQRVDENHNLRIGGAGGAGLDAERIGSGGGEVARSGVVPEEELFVFSAPVGDAAVFFPGHVGPFRPVEPADRIGGGPARHQRSRGDPEPVGARFGHFELVFREARRFFAGGVGAVVLQVQPAGGPGGPAVGERGDARREAGVPGFFAFDPDHSGARKHRCGKQQQGCRHGMNQPHGIPFNQLLSEVFQLKPSLPQ